MSRTLNEEKTSMRQQYEHIAIRYAALLLRNWGVDMEEGFWVGGEIGGVFCCCDEIFLTLEEIIFCYENDIKMDTVSEWLDYCVQTDELGFGKMTLAHWTSGAPRVSQGFFDKIAGMKREIVDLCNREKERLGDARKDF